MTFIERMQNKREEYRKQGDEKAVAYFNGYIDALFDTERENEDVQNSSADEYIDPNNPVALRAKRIMNLVIYRGTNAQIMELKEIFSEQHIMDLCMGDVEATMEECKTMAEIYEVSADRLFYGK